MKNVITRKYDSFTKWMDDLNTSKAYLQEWYKDVPSYDSWYGMLVKSIEPFLEQLLVDLSYYDDPKTIEIWSSEHYVIQGVQITNRLTSEWMFYIWYGIADEMDAVQFKLAML